MCIFGIFVKNQVAAAMSLCPGPLFCLIGLCLFILFYFCLFVCFAMALWCSLKSARDASCICPWSTVRLLRSLCVSHRGTATPWEPCALTMKHPETLVCAWNTVADRDLVWQMLGFLADIPAGSSTYTDKFVEALMPGYHYSLLWFV